MKNFTKIALMSFAVMVLAPTQRLLGKCTGRSCSISKVKAKQIIAKQPNAKHVKKARKGTCKKGVCSLS